MGFGQRSHLRGGVCESEFENCGVADGVVVDQSAAPLAAVVDAAAAAHTLVGSEHTEYRAR